MQSWMELKYLSLSLSHQLPHEPQQPPPPIHTHRTRWFCITGRQKVILAVLANLCEHPLWLCRVKPSALILFYRSSSEVLPVLGGRLFLHILVVPCFAVLTTWMVYCHLIYKSVEAAVRLHSCPNKLYGLEPTQEYLMCGTAVLSSGQKV